MKNNLIPNLVLDANDTGDETLKRFRYQITYSCIASLSILKTSMVSEVYCEHFEDILVRLTTGKFVGIQVKTKDLKLGAFDCNDQAVIGCIKKFVKLNDEFIDQFDRFVIVTNNDFSKIKPAVDLSIFIDFCKKGIGQELLKARSKSKIWINKISKACKCSTESVLKVLAKVELRPFSNLNDIRKALIDELRTIDKLTSFTYGKLESLTDSLILRHFKAASLDHENHVQWYLSTTPQEQQIQNIIDSKKITKDILQDIIENSIQDPVSLFLKDSLQIDSMPGGYDKLEIKMDAGKISSDNISLFKDNKYSVETLMASWLYKDLELADKKYNQLRLIIHNECQAVYDELMHSGKDSFGMEMLTNVRRNLKRRYNDDKASFYDCKFEHLLGMAGVLTEECKIWWSEKFEINLK